MLRPWRCATLLLLAGLFAAAPPEASAEEWHEAYRAGVQALSRGNAQGAVSSLKRAIALRPEPGRNVLTYGTNFEPRYFPYLRLAEACLALGQLAEARTALDASASRGVEPAAERQALLARVEAAVEASKPPPTTVAVAPPPPSTTVPPVTEPAAPATPTTLAPAPAPPTTTLARASAAVASPPATVPATTLPPAPTTLAPASPAPAAAPSAAPAPPAAGPGASWLVFGAVALALVAAVAWTVLRKPAAPADEPASLPSLALDTPRSGSGSHVSPGTSRDGQGREWFGDFRLLGLLGRGGMASVYKAERQGELVALKRPLGSFLEDQEFLARFLREADIGRTLNHPNIVRILARGHVAEVPYFTMELLSGETLQALVAKRGALAPREAASLVAQIAEALDFAHSKGVVHRDLKPSNIMVLADGTAKVMDFGIARAARFDGLTATGAFMGTPDYVAPEVIEGRGAEARSDLYSLGALFYELMAGVRPFTGETAFAILRKHCSEAPRPPSQVAPAVPAELDALVLRLLAKAPADRPASAEDLVVSLRDWLNRAA